MEGKRVRLEWLVNGVWEPYTAWYPADLREHLTRSLEGKKQFDSLNTYRLVEEDDHTE